MGLDSGRICDQDVRFEVERFVLNRVDELVRVRWLLVLDLVSSDGKSRYVISLSSRAHDAAFQSCCLYSLSFCPVLVMPCFMHQRAAAGLCRLVSSP